MLIVDFPTLEDVHKWLAMEPYVTGDVWRKIDIKPCRVGLSFEKKASKMLKNRKI